MRRTPSEEGLSPGFFFHTRVLPVMRQSPRSAVSSGLWGPPELIQDCSACPRGKLKAWSLHEESTQVESTSQTMVPAAAFNELIRERHRGAPARWGPRRGKGWP